MAYANLIAQATANRAEVFMRFRDFVCKRVGTYDYSTTGIGWTLHDSSYAVDEDTPSTNDWYVIYSAGESGDEDLYFRVTYIANALKIEGFLYWNNSTHAGVQQYNSSNNWDINDADVPILWIYGDLDAIFGISRETSVAANFHPAYFGKMETVFSDAVISCASSLTAGTDVTINVGSVPSGWVAGESFFIRDTAGLEKATITSVTATEIVATLANSYLANSKLSLDLGYYAPNSMALGSSIIVLINHSGSKAASSGGFLNANGILSFVAPDAMSSKHGVIPFFAANGGRLKNVWKRHSTGMTALNVYQDSAGTNYRAFLVYNSVPIVVKEV